MGEAPRPAQARTVAARQRARRDQGRGLLVRDGQDHGVRGQVGVPAARRTRNRAVPSVTGYLDGSDLGAQGDLGAELGQHGRGRVAVQFAQREGGDADVRRVVLAEQAGLHHGGGQRQRGVVARDVQGRDREQVPQGAAGPLALPPRGQPVTEPLRVSRRVGRVDEAHRERGAGNPDSFGPRKKRVPAQGRQHMQGAGQRGPAEPGLLAGLPGREPGARTVTSKRSCSGACSVMPSLASRPR